jgi:predicted flap endonuclease-1-like 5' DNA nuclease
MTKLSEIEGIGEKFEAKLKEAGINSIEALLEKGATPSGRKDLASATGIADALILKWVNRADLFRVKGIGEEYSDLLEAAGVDTAVELAQRKAENLHAKLVEVNTAKKVVRQLPTPSAVAGWIESAKTLPRIVSY